MLLLTAALAQARRSSTASSKRCGSIEGAYALVALTNKKLIGARDPLGIRPLVLGELDGCPILTSETCALDIIGAKFVRDIENGEVIVIDATGVDEPEAVPAAARCGPASSNMSISPGPTSIVHGRSRL